MNDEQLIDATLSGNREAFGELARRYQDRVYNLAFQIVGNSEDAMDVTQEAFLQALSHLDSFRRTSRFYTWLYRIAYNCAVGCVRRRKRAVSMESLTDEYGDAFVAKVDAPDANACREDDVAILRKALQQLSPEYREPLILREIEGANYEQIAEILGVPIGTVRSRLHRARATLREILERSGVYR